jgi:hypothetical protein
MQTTDTNDKKNTSGDRTVDQNDAENTSEALKQAEKDITNDPELTPEPDPAADLDEGELARLEGED